MGLRLGSISRIACSSGLASLLLAVPACGGDDDPCGALARLCADEGRPVAVGLRVEDAVFVDLDGDGEDEAVALSVSGQQVGLAGARGRIALQLFGEQPVGLAALPGEVAVAMQKPPGIAIFGMDGAGRLERRRDIPLSMPPTALRGADLSGDGAPELIAGLVALDERGPGTGQVAVIDPRTGAVCTFAAGTHPYALDVGDLDGDGRLDVVAVDRGESTLRVLLGLGDGRLGPARAYSMGSPAVGLDLADYDGDGDPDAVTRDPGSVRVHRNDGVGELSTPIALPLPVQTPESRGLAVGPVASSGLVGVSVPHGSQLRTWFARGGTMLGHVDRFVSSTVTWLGPGADGTLLVGSDGLLARLNYRRSATPIEVWSSGKLAKASGGVLATGDLNGDHLLDLAVATDGRLMLFHGRADLGFDDVGWLELPEPATDLVIANVTGSPTGDVVVAGETHVHLVIDGLVWGASVESAVPPKTLVPLRGGAGGRAVVAVVGARRHEGAESPGLSILEFSAVGVVATERVVAGSLFVERVAAVDFDDDGVDEPLILARRDDIAVLTRLTPSDAGYDPGPEHDLVALSGVALDPATAPSLAVADLDGDGAPEAVLQYAQAALRVSGLTTGAPAATSVGGVSATHLRDVDRDGHPDAVYLSDYLFGYWRGRGDGTFEGEYLGHSFSGASALALATAANAQFDLAEFSDVALSSHLIREVERPVHEATVRFPSAAHELHVADLDGDGSDDVVTAGGFTPREGSLAWLWGSETAPLVRGAGLTWHEGETFHEVLRAPTTGDLDGDGLLEVVAIDLRGELHSVNVGRGLEVRPIDAEPSEAFVAGLAIADLDADARPDLARLISVAEGKSYVCALEVAYGVGPYQFGPWTRLAKAPNAQLVELGIGNVDDDGDVDLLISPSVGYAALVLATGPRTWAEARAVSAGAERGRSMFSRADARGRVDLVTHAGAAIYRHTDQPTAPRAELVRDEALLGSDLLRVTDADGDGRYDLVVADAAQTHVWLLGDDGPRRVTVADARLDAVEFADIDGDRHPDLIGLSAGALFVRRTGK